MSTGLNETGGEDSMASDAFVLRRASSLSEETMLGLVAKVGP